MSSVRRPSSATTAKATGEGGVHATQMHTAITYILYSAFNISNSKFADTTTVSNMSNISSNVLTLHVLKRYQIKHK